MAARDRILSRLRQARASQGSPLQPSAAEGERQAHAAAAGHER